MRRSGAGAMFTVENDNARALTRALQYQSNGVPQIATKPERLRSAELIHGETSGSNPVMTIGTR